ncbi:putative glycoprotein [Wenling thamnaconus septentrionalis filovirus]|uniref:Putative glycoprotein n=1 Tax=Wenling thamnaconus septentrionalis filovirus TaxID=2116488 RepID=A0A2P1GML9_9MONO|nr:putative glycoprotein [Wenling thamnaconus septentrionalis filovirus]AVM87245.1 putative glycoprotein [Wenling thamnaconus septentrionalis filovirus]
MLDLIIELMRSVGVFRIRNLNRDPLGRPSRSMSLLLLFIIFMGSGTCIEILVNKEGATRQTMDFKADLKSAVIFPRWGIIMKPQRELVLSNGHILIPAILDLGHVTPVLGECGGPVYGNITRPFFEKTSRLVHRSEAVLKDLSKITTGIVEPHGARRSRRSIMAALAIGKTLASLVTGGWKIYNSFSRGRELNQMKVQMEEMMSRMNLNLNMLNDNTKKLKKELYFFEEEFEKQMFKLSYKVSTMHCGLQRVSTELQASRWVTKWEPIVDSLMVQPINNRQAGSLFTVDALSGLFHYLEERFGSLNPYSACPECTLATMTVSHVGGGYNTLALMIELPNLVQKESFIVMEPSYFPVFVGDNEPFMSQMERTVVVKDGKGFTLDTQNCDGERSTMICDIASVNLRELGPVKDWDLDSELVMRRIDLSREYWLAYPLYDSIIVFTAEEGTCRIRRLSGQYMTLPSGLQQLNGADGGNLECQSYSIAIPQGAHTTPLSIYGNPPSIRSPDGHEVELISSGILSGHRLTGLLNDDDTNVLYDLYMSDDKKQGSFIAVNQFFLGVVLVMVVFGVVWFMRNRSVIKTAWAGVKLYGIRAFGFLKPPKVVRAGTGNQKGLELVPMESVPLSVD